MWNKNFRLKLRSIMTIIGVLLSLLSILVLIGVMFLLGKNLVGDKLEEEATKKPTYSEIKQTTDRRLNNYGWFNKSKGIVHIPIKKAMELIVKNPDQYPKAEKKKSDPLKSKKPKNSKENNE